MGNANYTCKGGAKREHCTKLANGDMVCECCQFLPRCMECRRGLTMIILYVRLSVKRVNCDKTEEKSVQIFIP